MGIDYSSAIAYGFKADKEKLRALYADAYDDGGIWEAIEAALEGFDLLGFAFGGPYDGDDEVAVIIDSTYSGHSRYDNAFGVFPIRFEWLGFTQNEREQINAAYINIGTGNIGPLAIFNCS